MRKVVFVLVIFVLAGCAGMQNQAGRSARSSATAPDGTPLCIKLGDTGCAGALGPAGVAGLPGAQGPVGPKGATIPSVVASPPVIRPGAPTHLLATVGDTSGKVYTYKWRAADGTLTAGDANPATWTAPDAVGSYVVEVEMSDGAETVKGYGTVTVSVMPIGPIITGVTPVESKSGEVIAVTGVGFGGSQGKSKLNVGGADADQILSWSDTEIRAGVPKGAVTGAVKATVAGVESSLGRIVALWNAENPENRVVSTGTHEHVVPQIVSDGGDGALVVWQDNHAGGKTGNDIYAQKINSLGESLWDAVGLTVSSAVDNQGRPQMVADGAGGALVVWEDARTGTSVDVYAQRINAAGDLLWDVKGVAVAVSPNDQTHPRLIADGAGGAVVIWQDFRTGAPHIYAQRLSGEGKALWAAGGVAVATSANGQSAARVVADGMGGVVVAWQDFRNGKHNDVYAQRVDGDGKAIWAENGVVLSAAVSDQVNPALRGDGAGGAVVAWEDLRNGTSYIYAQRVNGEGKIQWAQDGVAVAAPAPTQVADVAAMKGHPVKVAMAEATDGQTAPQMVSDALGGTIVVWQDARGGHGDIYAQRMSNEGKAQWTAGGVGVSHASGMQSAPSVVADGVGGAIVSWDDHRNGSQSDVYGQRVNNAGRIQWTYGGTAVSTAGADQSAARMLADGAGGAIFVWQDARNGTPNIYAQKVSGGGLQ